MATKPTCLVKAFLLLATFFAGSFFAGSLYAADPIPLTDEERQWLNAHPVIQIAPDPNFAPIEYIDDNGVFQGISADYIALIEEKLGIKFTVVTLPDWDAVLEKARAGEIDMIGAANATPQREEYMSFTNSHIFLPGVILTRDNIQSELTLADIRDQNIAAVSSYTWFDLIGNDRQPEVSQTLDPDYAWSDFIADDSPNLKVEGVALLTQGLRDLSLGNTDAVISDLATAGEIIRNEGLTNLRIMGNTGYNFTLAFGVRKDWPELTAILNKAIATISPEENEAILQKWVKFDQGVAAPPEVLYAIAAMAIIIFFAFLWNRILGHRVALRTQELDAAQQELLASNVDLEKRVQERTQKLQHTLQQLQTSQTQLIQSEKMATMGQLVAGVAHEINTPLGYVYNNVQLLTDFVSRVDQHTSEFTTLSTLMSAEDANDEQISAQFQRVQKFNQEITDDNGLGETRELIKDSTYGLRQISELVLSLKDFSRIDRAVEEGVDLHQNIEHTLKIAQHLTKNCAEIIKRYGDIPQVRCNPSQINQVLLNVVTNSCQAIQEMDMSRFGKILISTEFDDDYVYVSIQDDGAGMPKDVGERIFEPFYTTKKSGGGTGLGMSISYNILKDHNAKLHLHSRPGKGTLFKFGLPRKASQRQAEQVIEQPLEDDDTVVMETIGA